MLSAGLHIERLSARRGDFSLDQVSLSAAAGEYHVLLGPTGCGKTTLLRTVLGLTPPDGGEIRLDGRALNGVATEERRLGYLPQQQFLFPHLDVAGNILFGARTRSAGERARRLDELSAMLGLQPLLRRAIGNLSGGERQKVALARALAARPGALLLDEPFSAIDEGTRRELWFDLSRAVTATGIPCLHVTHNLDEAYTLGGRVSVLMAGRIVQAGPPREILEQPASAAVARFLGYRNIFRGPARPRPGGCSVAAGNFEIFVPQAAPGGEATVCIRPQDIKIIQPDTPLRDELSANVFTGEITALFHLPDVTVAQFRLAHSPREYDLDMRFPALITARYGLAAGQEIRIGFWAPNLLLW